MAEMNTSTQEMTIIMWSNPGLSEYIGSKAMLEAEGIKPKAWPKGFDFANWQDDANRYSLRRERPQGAKGPRRAFADVDWWNLSWQPLNRPTYEELAIARKRKELADEIYRQSPEGIAEWRKSRDSYLQAQGDDKFQAFKALLGLVPPKRERKPRKSKANASEE